MYTINKLVQTCVACRISPWSTQRITQVWWSEAQVEAPVTRRCDITEDKLLTFNQVLELVLHPQRSCWLWPASQYLVPVGADWRQQRVGSRLGISGPAMVQTAVVVTVTGLNVTGIDHQERSHQHCLQHLHWQITQLLQQQHHLHFHSAQRDVVSNDCPTTYWQTLDDKTQQGNHRHQTSPPYCIWRQSQTAWRPLTNTLHILTTCFSTGPTVLLPTPRAVWPIMWKHNVIHKQKVHDVFHCCQRKNEPRPQVTRTGNFKVCTSGVWDIQADRQTVYHRDRQTYGHAHRNTSHSYMRVTSLSCTVSKKLPLSQCTWLPVTWEVLQNQQDSSNYKPRVLSDSYVNKTYRSQ